MHTRKSLGIISGVILAAVVMLALAARADEWDQSTKLTFNQPVEIPGHKILAAGTYYFVTLADFSSADSNVVQIFNADRTRLYATLPTAAIERSTPSGNSEVNFAQSSDNQPKALLSWFYAGRKIGHEFIYDRQEEQTMASEPVVKVVAQPVRSTNGATYGN